MRTGFLATAAVAALGLALPGQDAAPRGVTIVRAGKVFVGDGRVLDAVRLRLEGGKVAAIVKDEGALPDGARVVDYRRRVLIPGIVAAYTDLAAQDQQRNLTPDLVASEQFDFYRKWPRLLRSGLTTVYLSPGRVRLLPGQGSVVKLAGKSPAARLLAEQAALRVQIAPAARRGIPAVFEPTPAPTAEDPLLPARRQRGTTRASQLQVLAGAFAEARDPDRQRGGRGPADERYLLAPLRAALSGALRVRLAAWSAADILHGLEFLEGLGARPIVERPVQPLPLADRLARDATPCIVQMPLTPARPVRGDFVPGDERTPHATPEAPGALSRAGVPVAIVPATDADLDKLRMLAGLACRFGMGEDKALAAITLEAARILGVDDRVGSIEKGKDADFVVLSGEPFDARSRVERVWVDGDEVFEPSEPLTAFAIRAGRVLVGDGTEHRNATLVVRGGKIVDVGPNATLPAGADVIDVPGSVLVPGFIAAATRLGLHADKAAAKLQAATSVDVAGALAFDDPAFRRALEAGVTTLFVTPDDSGLVGGRVCAVKTQGQKKGFLVRDVTGLRMVLGAGGKKGKAQILGAIKKARTYLHPPAKTAKKKATKKEEPKQVADPITGHWAGTVSGGPLPQAVGFTVDMKLAGKKVDATLTISAMPVPLHFTGTFEDGKLELEGDAPPPIGKLTCSGRLENGKISGTITSSQGELAFTMERKSGPTAAAAAATDKDAAKDKKDEALEPFRRILAKEAPLVVRVASAEAARAAIDAVVTESKLDLVLAGNPRDVIRKKVRPPRPDTVGFLLGCDEVVFDEKGQRHNLGQELTDLGYRVILVTRAQAGTRYLPVHAAWAVATGFDPRRALSSITAAPARCFGLGDRIGRLAEGRDADFVLLSGDPFDLTTRVLGVWVDGVLRVDRMQRDEHKEDR